MASNPLPGPSDNALVLPPPTSRSSNGARANSGLVVTPWKPQFASCSPEMTSTFSPEAF